MALEVMLVADVIEAMEGFLAKRRPPVEMRDQLDLLYKIEGQSVIIYELAPQWNKPEIIREMPLAKTTWVNTQKVWKIYWMRADLKWHTYEAKPEVKNIKQFAKIVEEDKYHCFFG
jgi:hypothetical protein